MFCNNFLCSEHIVKKREDPAVPGEFVDICRDCENNILFERLNARVCIKILNLNKKNNFKYNEAEKI